MRALCVQLALLRSIVQGQAGIPFPQHNPHGWFIGKKGQWPVTSVWAVSCSNETCRVWTWCLYLQLVWVYHGFPHVFHAKPSKLVGTVLGWRHTTLAWNWGKLWIVVPPWWPSTLSGPLSCKVGDVTSAKLPWFPFGEKLQVDQRLIVYIPPRIEGLKLGNQSWMFSFHFVIL